MPRNLPQLIIMLSGATLIVVGVVLVFMQLSHEMAAPGFRPSTRSFGGDATGSITLTTTYVGLVVIAIGALLEMVGFLAARPWRAPAPAER